MDPHRFVKDILTQDIIEKLEIGETEPDLRKNSEQFQLEYFEDFFISGEKKFKLF